MNRIIKFRVWDTSENKMTNWDDIKRHIHRTGEAMWFYFGEDEIMIPMQFTGLYDKNGKEIYEGDICKITNSWHTFTRECKFIGSTFGFEGTTGVFIPNAEYMEVVGNIYQNTDRC